jgi:hypothetical protein
VTRHYSMTAPLRRGIFLASPASTNQIEVMTDEAMTLTANQRRALEMLAGSPHGCTEGTLRTHGFKVGLLTGLVSAGLATANPESVKAGGQTLSLVRFKITHAGLRAIDR